MRRVPSSRNRQRTTVIAAVAVVALMSLGSSGLTTGEMEAPVHDHGAHAHDDPLKVLEAPDFTSRVQAQGNDGPATAANVDDPLWRDRLPSGVYRIDGTPLRPGDVVMRGSHGETTGECEPDPDTAVETMLLAHLGDNTTVQYETDPETCDNFITSVKIREGAPVPPSDAYPHDGSTSSTCGRTYVAHGVTLVDWGSTQRDLHGYVTYAKCDGTRTVVFVHADAECHKHDDRTYRRSAWCTVTNPGERNGPRRAGAHFEAGVWGVHRDDHRKGEVDHLKVDAFYDMPCRSYHHAVMSPPFGAFATKGSGNCR